MQSRGAFCDRRLPRPAPGLVGLLVLLARRRQRQNMPKRVASSEVVKNVGEGVTITGEQLI